MDSDFEAATPWSAPNKIIKFSSPEAALIDFIPRLKAPFVYKDEGDNIFAKLGIKEVSPYAGLLLPYEPPEDEEDELFFCRITISAVIEHQKMHNPTVQVFMNEEGKFMLEQLIPAADDTHFEEGESLSLDTAPTPAQILALVNFPIAEISLIVGEESGGMCEFKPPYVLN